MLLSKNKASFSLKILFVIRIFIQKGSFSIQIYILIPQEDHEKQIPDTLKTYTEICRDQPFRNTGQLVEALYVC